MLQIKEEDWLCLVRFCCYADWLMREKIGDRTAVTQHFIPKQLIKDLLF